MRIYGIWLDDTEVDEHQHLAGLFWPFHKMYINGHYTMDDPVSTSTVTDTGVLSQDGTLIGKPTYVEVQLLLSILVLGFCV